MCWTVPGECCARSCGAVGVRMTHFEVETHVTRSTGREGYSAFFQIEPV